VNDDETIEGLILEEQVQLTLGELAQLCSAHAEWLVGLVDEGILQPSGEQLAEWRFSGICLIRARTVQRLQRDLGINLPGAALVLDLLEEPETLRARGQ
jgi:chaperone modulatory protein CbpM